MKRITFFKELRSFLLLWGSQAVSGLGTAMTDFALIIWVHGQAGTASSVTMLTLCSFLPTILFRFAAGALADTWNKKRIMLLADFVAACGTAAILVLYSFSALRLWHIYLINVLLSFMNAFQTPAAFTATSLLVPKKHYTRVGGLQSFAGAATTILAPALGSCFMAFGGLTAVLIFDLASFAVAFCVLLFLIQIPETVRAKEERQVSLMSRCLEGVRYLREHTALLHLTLLIAVINFLAKLGGDGMLSPFVLARTGNNQQALGMVQSAVALGLLAGSCVAMVMKPVKNKVKLVFITLALTFTGNIAQSLSVLPWVWCAANFASYLTAAVMNAYLTAIMREQVPPEMQGRVFSAKDTLQNGTIPLGLFLGGMLADHVFEPLMQTPSPLQRALSRLFGAGNGAGLAVMFFCVGVLGVVISLLRLRKPIYKALISKDQS